MIKYISRIGVVLLAFICFMAAETGALETSELVSMRSEIFMQSEQMKPLLEGSGDVVLLSSMWDSYIIATHQLDAYFFMIGILNTIERQDVTARALDYLDKWLANIKKTNDINIKSLDSVSYRVEPATEPHMRTMKNIFTRVNESIEKETKKIEALKLRASAR